ncbi:hypothetical protein RP726_14595 [Candidatus Methylospira mobilis]|uniref:hypothetical protein n=1 Tax=Candidatus Methylospira mobilis TaxID=1808979 RepID=UPI0028F12F8A|nr:hypothetical protein [Candidatus Methylospira mobilis]WNV03665.1 hypothetical protein RP726_14595 [Candidatus Methylospira mobilis]
MGELKKCFVLMPFDEKYREVYAEVYKPACADNGLECWRVDEIARPGSITRDIVEGILDADILIADLTSRNPNVFYELGIAHTVGNKTIMTAQRISDVPFDIANFRVLFYEQSISGSRKLFTELDKAIKELLVALDRTNNPFQEVVSLRSPLGHRRRTPLVKYVDINSLPKHMREWLTANSIMYAEDVAKIDLESMANTPGLGKTSLGKFLAQVLEHDLYPDGEKLQQVIVKHGLRVKADSRGYWY